MKKAGLLLCGAAIAASIALLDAQTTVSGVLFVEGWESGTLSGSFNSAYYGNSSSSQFRVQNAVVGSGNWAFEHRLPAGVSAPSIQYATQHFGDAPSGPVPASGRGGHFHDLYVQYKIAYSPGFTFQNRSSPTLKQLIIGTQDNRRHDDPCCNPWVAHYMTIYPPQPAEVHLLAEANNKQAATGQWVGFTQNVGGFSPSHPFLIQAGRFYTVEVRRRLNDPGQDNGIFQMWIDGTLLSDYRAVRYRVPFNGSFGADLTYGTNFVMISDYVGEPVASDQSVYYDDVKISTSYIGLGSAGINPPGPPQNVRLIR